MDDIAHLQEQRKLLWRNVKNSHNLLRRAHNLCMSLEARHMHDKEQHETVDHQLALLDGRLKILPPAMTEKKGKIQIDLTEEQINEIALRLGIELPEVEEEEVPDESQEE
jgi:hypothetical protein